MESQVLDAKFSNLLQQRFALLGVLVDPRLGLNEHLAATSFDHVAQQRPRRTTEANQRHPACQFLSGHGDRLVDIVKRLCYIHLPLENLLVLLVLWRLQRVGEVRALFVHHYDFHAHCLRDYEDVGEDDGGVDEAGVALDGLESEGRGDLGAATALKEVILALCFVILGEVAAGCTSSACDRHVMKHAYLVASPISAGARLFRLQRVNPDCL